MCSLLAGHSLSLDALTKQNPKLLLTMEDYLWAKLTLVNSTQGAAAAGGHGGAGSSMVSGPGQPSGGPDPVGVVLAGRQVGSIAL